MRYISLAFLLAAIPSFMTSVVSAEDPVAQPGPIVGVERGAPLGGDLLGAAYENESAGISLRLPAGCRRVQSTGAGDDLGQFADENRKWQLKLMRIMRPGPTALVGGTDPFGKSIPGLLDQTVLRLQHDLSGSKILRQDLTNIADGDPKVKDNVAMIALRYSTAGIHYLTQQAIIQANDRLFYLIALTTPGSDATGEAAENDPIERVAVETFRQMLDTVRLLDTAAIAQDQRERLYRTRTLMYNWSKARLRAALIEEQWLRLLKDGRDVGYSYITEQTAAGVPRPLKPQEIQAGKSDRELVQPGDGVLIGIRARSIDRPPADSDQKARGPAQVDSATWLFVMPDRRLEDWSRVTVVGDGTVDKDGRPNHRQMTEFGSSDKQVIRSLDKNAMPGNGLDVKEPPISVREEYTLNVTTIGQTGAGEPVMRELPPFYLPQALGHLLPRLLPLQSEMGADGRPRPRSYMFATYVPDAHEIMLRYVDVGAEQQVTFAGKSVRAIPISDRVGWNGSITIHYMAPDGRYLGSENKDSHLLIVPTDAATLLSIWKGADLTRPGATERPRAIGQPRPERG